MEIRHDVFLASKTTFGIGGRAARLVCPTAATLKEALRLARDDRRVLRLGAGSKLLVSDGGFDGTVLDTAGLNGIVFHGHRVWAGAGVRLPALSVACAKAGLSGLEWACGIPASVGGAVCLHASCFGSCLGDVLNTVDAVSVTSGKDALLPVKDCDLGYHTSLFRARPDLLVTGATLSLVPDTPSAVLARMQVFRDRRRATQPTGVRSAGSAFCRVEQTGAGYYVERARLKGFCVGQAQISPKHANFIVNLGAATCKDVTKLLEYICTVVKAQFGVLLRSDYIEVNNEAYG